MKTKYLRVVALLVALTAQSALAENFIGLGLPGPKGKFGLLSFQNFINGPQESVYPVSFVTVTPTYYTNRGFTKDRDIFQFYAGAAVGYVNGPPSNLPSGTSTYDRIGWGLPHIGLQWYFNAVRPVAVSNKPGAAKFTWWFSPYVFLYMPNGSNKNYGFDGFFGNRFQFSIGLQNGMTLGNFAMAFMPAAINFTGPYLQNLSNPNNKQQLDIDIMDFAVGYALHSTFYVGFHHVYTFKNVTADPTSQWGEGRIGPGITWLGLASKGLYVFANVNLTYVTSNPIASPKTTSINGCLLYIF